MRMLLFSLALAATTAAWAKPPKGAGAIVEGKWLRFDVEVMK